MKRTMLVVLAVPILIFAAAESAYADVVSGPTLLAASAGLLIGAGIFVLAVVALAWFVLHRMAKRRKAKATASADQRAVDGEDDGKAE
jgi:uncharacterized membrane protein